MKKMDIKSEFIRKLRLYYFVSTISQWFVRIYTIINADKIKKITVNFINKAINIQILMGLLILSFIILHFELAAQSVRGVGKILYENTSMQVKSPADGIIFQILVKNGQSVKAGQVLAVLNVNQADKFPPLPGNNQNSESEVLPIPINLPTLNLPPINSEEIQLKPKIYSVNTLQNRSVQKVNTQEKNNIPIKPDEVNQGVTSKKELEMLKEFYQNSPKSSIDKSNRSISANQDKILLISYTPAKESKPMPNKVIATKISNQDSSPAIVFKKKMLFAPVDGIIKMQGDYKQGDFVKNGNIILSLTPSNPKLYVDIKIHDKRFKNIQLQQRISFEVKGLSEKFFGSIQSIKMSDYKTKDNVHDYIIRIKPEKIRVVGTNGKIYQLKPGMSAVTKFLNK